MQHERWLKQLIIRRREMEFRKSIVQTIWKIVIGQSKALIEN
jgi:hypothetical protein